MLKINQTPKIIYNELETNPLRSGEGYDIPVFIGRTGNTIENIEIKQYKNFNQLNRSVEDGGIGTDSKNNPLLRFLQDFYEEVEPRNNEDIGVPYVFVIDLGDALSTDTDLWKEALSLAKTDRTIQVEAYIGFDANDTHDDILKIISEANQLLKEDLKYGNPRIGYYSVDTTDDDLMTLTGAGASNSSRIGLIHPFFAGKTLASILVTPYYIEPGYRALQTINPEIVPRRTPTEELTLQNAGVIFLRNEIANTEVYTKICLGVSTGFANTPRPNDSLLHHRRNTDHLVRRLYQTLYKQLKRNETEVNISYCQTDVDIIIDEEKMLGAMKDKTEVIVRVDDVNPFHLVAEGVACPVNSSVLIELNMYVEV